MKNSKTYLITLATLTALASAPLCSAAEAEVKVHTDATPDASVNTDVNRNTPTTRVEDAAAIRALGVQKPNKASGLLGMEVQNYQNQKLGEIKDLVLDINSGKVSYAVVAVGGFLGIGEKLIAVPPSALAVSEDQTFVRLNADKAKIEAAPGFAATNWPRLGDPSITTHRYWMGDTSTGAPGGVQSETSTRLYTSPDDVNANAHVRATGDYKTLHGKVRAVDLPNRKIVIDTDSGSKKVVNVDEQATLGDTRLKNMRLDDLKPGADITVKYTSHLGRITAYNIESTNP